MSLTLGISTSSSQFRIVLGEKGKVLFHSGDDPSLNASDGPVELIKDISPLLVKGLESTGAGIKEIKKIIVDIGPGGTSSVRTGVAFANGLSYSLGIPVCPVSSMELIGIECWEKYGLSVVVAVKSVRGNAYVGLYNGRMAGLKYGLPEQFIHEMVAPVGEFVVAGAFRNKVIELFPDREIRDSGIQSVNALLLVERESLFEKRAAFYPNLPVPLTEQMIPAFD